MNRDPSVAGLASLVQSRGRNGDSMLVHMTPDEVRGLNALALAHGGQLSINPETGLYEANFLKKLLPTIIGLALAPLTAGTSLAFLGNPLVAGALVGGVEGLRTGDLGRGLMAGLGAFGGAGLGAGLSAAAGTAGATGTAASTAGNLTAEQIASNAIKNAGTFGYNSVIPAAQTATSAAAQTAGTEVAKQGFFNTLGRGAQALTSEAGRTAFMNAVPGGMTGIAAGGMGIANAMTPEFKPPMSPEEEEQLYYQSYGYDPSQGRFLGGQFVRGYPGYPGYAMGGAVMPRANFNYPQAGISKSSYAPSIDYTQPREVLDGYEVKLDPFTGEEKFAEGGEVGMMAPDELKNFLTVDPGAPPPDQFAPITNHMGMNPRTGEYYNAAPQNPFPVGAPMPEPMDMPQNPENDRTYVKPIWEILGMTREDYLNQAGRPPVGTPMPTTPLPEEPIYTTMPVNPRYDFATAPQQSLEQYYQSLLTPPQQRPADNSFMNYMQSFNNFVTSPIAPPKPPVQPPQGPPNKPPGDDRVTGTGGTGTGMVYDPTTGKFVPGTGSPGDQNIDFDAIRDAVSGMFPGFNMNFGDLSNYLGSNTGGMTFDPVTGTFRQPGSQTINTPPGTTTTDLNQNQNQFDPNNFQFNPFVDGFDMSSLPGYGQNDFGGNISTQIVTPGMKDGVSGYYTDGSYQNFVPDQQAAAVGNLTGIDQFADPMYNQPFQYDFSGLGQMGDLSAMSGMGDMGGYGTQFQGFQPLSTDFGSTYQPPAMNQPTFDYSAYAPQQMDFGSMGFGLGSLPSIASTYQPQAVATPTFDMSSFQMPASQSPMMTGGDTGMSNMSTAPQLGFGNSDVLYGRTDFGMGGSNNIFGFAGGGSVQRAAAGKLITGNGDGMSDDIRANINGDQEARLADGEFVIPADVVSHLGNGSTDAGAEQLHAMMDRIRKARTGRSRQAPEIDPDEFMPA